MRKHLKAKQRFCSYKHRMGSGELCLLLRGAAGSTFLIRVLIRGGGSVLLVSQNR